MNEYRIYPVEGSQMRCSNCGQHIAEDHHTVYKCVQGVEALLGRLRIELHRQVGLVEEARVNNEAYRTGQIR